MPNAPRLFQPFALREVVFRNRAWLSPMCQYSVFREDGKPTDWHLTHLGSRAAGGFGLVLAEAAAVSPEGRISPRDTGIWNAEQRDAWQKIVAFVQEQGAAAGIQLAHAGRKGSAYGEFPTNPKGSVPQAKGGWETIAPSPVPFSDLLPPRELSPADIARVRDAFVAAAVRADQAGFDVIELHAAHGYLFHEFLSPLSNFRTDEYGGDFAGRTKFLLDTVEEVRSAWPASKPLFVRISSTDWTEGGWDLEQSVALAVLLAERGTDLVDVSSGGNVLASIPVGPSYQVPLAARVRQEAGVPVAAVGKITEPAQAEAVLAQGQADAVFLGRVALREPSWPLRAAAALGVPRHEAPYPLQHLRGSWEDAVPAYS